MILLISKHNRMILSTRYDRSCDVYSAYLLVAVFPGGFSVSSTSPSFSLSTELKIGSSANDSKKVLMKWLEGMIGSRFSMASLACMRPVKGAQYGSSGMITGIKHLHKILDSSHDVSNGTDY